MPFVKNQLEICEIVVRQNDWAIQYNLSSKDNKDNKRPKSRIQSVADHPNYKTKPYKWFEKTGRYTKGFR